MKKAGSHQLFSSMNTSSSNPHTSDTLVELRDVRFGYGERVIFGRHQLDGAAWQGHGLDGRVRRWQNHRVALDRWSVPRPIGQFDF